MNVASVSAARLVQDAGERRGSARRALCAARCGPPRCRSSTVRRRWASSSCPPTVPAAAARAARPRSTTSLHQVDGPSRSRWRAGRRGGWEADYLGARQQLLDVENPSCRVPNPYDRDSAAFVIDPVDDPAWLAANPLSSSLTCSCGMPLSSSSSRRPLRAPATKLMRSWISSQVASSGSS